MSTTSDIKRLLKCLYDIGKSGSESASTDEFLSAAADIVRQAVDPSGEAGVRITFRGHTFTSPGFRERPGSITEKLTIAGEEAGRLEVYAAGDSPYLDKESYLVKTLTEKLGEVIRQMELELSGGKSRAEDLEKVQQKLIRSERLAAVGEMASSVGHELRNPLNVIRNCACLLNMQLAGTADKEVLGTIETLDRQVDIANKIVADLMDFTRIQEPARHRTDLNSLVTESLSYASLPEAIRVSSRLHDKPLRTTIDPEQIGRVFTNIITNACQAMGEKGELDISTGAGDDASVWAAFKDTGSGIAPENIRKIFEPLFTTRPKGIGLGLAISKRLVEQNGGRIEVSSTPGKGTTFRIILPQATGRKS
jgi:signal transduction histidine kinase